MSTRMSNGPSITRDRGDVRTSSPLTFEFGTRKVATENGVIVLRRPIETTALIRSLSCPTCLFSNTAHARPRELPSANTAHRLRDSTSQVIYQNVNSSLGVACRVVEKQHWWWILAMVRRRPCESRVGLRSYVYDSRHSYFRLAGFNFGRSIAHSWLALP
jgi:hypothetical protein